MAHIVVICWLLKKRIESEGEGKITLQQDQVPVPVPYGLGMDVNPTRNVALSCCAFVWKMKNRQYHGMS